MKKLMTKYTFYVHCDTSGYLHVVVTRLADKATKYFFQAHGNVESMTNFMNSVTDDLADGYFPRPGKKVVEADNWAYIINNHGRVDAMLAASLNVESV